MVQHTSSAPVPSKEYDVVVVGAGPAGLMASLCSTTYGLSVLHIDDRPTTTAAGRADGLQPRTLEVLRNIGSVKVEEGKAVFEQRLIDQGVRVYSVAFWDPTETEQLARTSRAPSCPDFIDVVDNYTLLLHQGLIENTFVDEIEQRRALLPADKKLPAPHGGVFRPYTFLYHKTIEDEKTSHPVEVTVQNSETLTQYTVRAKYLLGCDGARSQVKRSISGPPATEGGERETIKMLGDVSDVIFAVVDVEVQTDFPDILSKCMIHSKDSGTIMVIPREDNLVRLYVQLQKGEGDAQSHIERSKATLDICFARAKKIFEPFELIFGRVAWFSVYQIGQRIANRYTLDHRVFLAGDAVHTHSPKAGQGMNISLLDAYSWAWKINLVEKGMADRDVLLPTYESERKSIAEELLKFDSAYTKLLSGQSPPQQSVVDFEVEAKAKKVGVVDPLLFIETFKKNAFFTSGCGAIYFAGPLSALPDSQLVKSWPKPGVFNPAGLKLVAGQRLLPGAVSRMTDANQVQIQQELRMTGSFRVHIFGGRLETSRESLQSFADFLASPSSFHNIHRPSSATPFASVLPTATPSSRHISREEPPMKPNPFFDYLTVLATPFAEWDVDSVPAALRQVRDRVYADDLPDRRVPGVTVGTLHTKYGIDLEKGAVVVVRPDGYVGAVVGLNEDGHAALNAYFSGFLTGGQ